MHASYHSRIYSLNENFFSTWTPYSAYVLGFWFADGNMRISKSYRIRFYSNDRDHLFLIRRVMHSNSPVFFAHDSNCSVFQVISKKMYFKISELGGRPAKSNTINFPDNLPDKLLPDFIRGYFDGDGSVHYITYKASKNSKYYTEIRSNFTCGSKIFLEKIREILTDELGITKRVIGQYGPHQFKLGYGQSDTFKLLKYLYYPGHKLSLKRKADYLKRIYIENIHKNLLKEELSTYLNAKTVPYSSDPLLISGCLTTYKVNC